MKFFVTKKDGQKFETDDSGLAAKARDKGHTVTIPMSHPEKGAREVSVDLFAKAQEKNWQIQDDEEMSKLRQNVDKHKPSPLAIKVDAIADKYQIEPSEARKYAELAGTTEPLGDDDSVLTRMAGLTGEKFLGGLPAFAYKKFQDDNTEKAFDEIRREVDKEKSYADMAVEMAGSIVPGSGVTKGLSLGAKGLGALAVGEGALSGMAESDVGQEADMAGLGAGLGVAGVGLGAGLGKLAQIKEYLNPAKLIPGTEAAKGGWANKALVKANQLLPFGGDIDEKTLTDLLDPQVRKSIKEFDLNKSADDVIARTNLAEEILKREVGGVYNKAAEGIKFPQSLESVASVVEEAKGTLAPIFDTVEASKKYYSPATKKAIAGVKDIMGDTSVTPFTEASDNIYKRALEARRYIDSQKSGEAFRALPKHEKELIGEARGSLNKILEQTVEGRDLREADALYSAKKGAEEFFDSLKTKGEFDLKKVLSSMKEGSANDYILSKKLDKLKEFYEGREGLRYSKTALELVEEAIEELKTSRRLGAAKGGVERSLGPTAQGSQIVAHTLAGTATGGLSLFGIPVTNPTGYLKALDGVSGVAKYAKDKIPSFDMPNLPQGSGGVFSRMPAQGIGKFQEEEDSAASDFLSGKGSYQK